MIYFNCDMNRCGDMGVGDTRNVLPFSRKKRVTLGLGVVALDPIFDEYGTVGAMDVVG